MRIANISRTEVAIRKIATNISKNNNKHLRGGF
jgi:hypothetical protein